MANMRNQVLRYLRQSGKVVTTTTNSLSFNGVTLCFLANLSRVRFYAPHLTSNIVELEFRPPPLLLKRFFEMVTPISDTTGLRNLSNNYPKTLTV